MKNSEYYAIGYFESISSKNFQNILTIFDVCDIIKMNEIDIVNAKWERIKGQRQI